MIGNGPGKYDWLATKAREEAKAGAVLLMVVDGTLGSGFSVQAIHPMYALDMPEKLEALARDIRKAIDAPPGSP